MSDDYYQTLGVTKTATEDEIRKAYRSLARKYHPDLNPDDEAAKKKFQEVQIAFEVLNDPKRRELYDRHGAGFEGAGPGGPERRPWPPRGEAGGQQFEFDFGDIFSGAGGPTAGGGGGGFADIFRQFGQRGGAGRGPTAARGNDIEYEITIPFNTAVIGGETGLNVRRATGKLETLNVKVPAGIDDGKRIRLRGQGDPGPGGGPAGDILLVVRVAPHPYFRRKGVNLELTVPITLGEAAMGAKIELPAPRGSITLTVPPGVSSGKKLRVRGQGVKPQGKIPGDLLAEIQIVLPNSLTDEDREELAAISNRRPQNPRSGLVW